MDTNEHECRKASAMMGQIDRYGYSAGIFARLFLQNAGETPPLLQIDQH